MQKPILTNPSELASNLAASTDNNGLSETMAAIAEWNANGLSACRVEFVQTLLRCEIVEEAWNSVINLVLALECPRLRRLTLQELSRKYPKGTKLAEVSKIVEGELDGIETHFVRRAEDDFKLTESYLKDMAALLKAETELDRFHFTLDEFTASPVESEGEGETRSAGNVLIDLGLRDAPLVGSLTEAADARVAYYQKETPDDDGGAEQPDSGKEPDSGKKAKKG